MQTEQGNQVQAAKATISDPRLLQAYDYWRQKAAGRPMPRRADIDPTEIPNLLRSVMLVDVQPDGRYRYRLIGTGNAEAHGANATGRYVDEILPGPEYKKQVLGLYDECVRTCRPLYSEFLFLSPERNATDGHTRVLFLPLSEDGQTVNMVMVMRLIRYIDQSMRDEHFTENRSYKEIVHVLI